jgi:sarcosine oxidase subunit alpha
LSHDRARIIFEGKPLECRADTTVAVALWENGIRHLSHSHKYGNHRGLTCARGHCTACLMRVDGIPNVRTCELPVTEGMKIEKQDAGAFYAPPMQKMLNIGGRLFPVGFYYKWFTRPGPVSRLFLDTIRPLTGVGRLPEKTSLLELPAAPEGEDPGTAPATDLGRIDTLIIGAGPAGLEQALEASGQLLVVDDHAQPGGQRYLTLKELNGPDGPNLDRFPVLAAAWRKLDPLVQRFQAERGADFRGGTKAIAGYAPHGILLKDKETLLTSTFGRLVWSAGALDTLGLFPGNDTPGLIGPRALYRLLTRDGMDVQNKRVLLVGSGLDLWLSAAVLAHRGAVVSLVVTGSGWQSEVSAAVDLGWQLTTGLQLAEVKPLGHNRIEAVFTPGRTAPGPVDSQLRLQADFAVICRRGKPTYDIPYQLGADMVNQPERGGFTSAEPEVELAGVATLAFRGEAAGLLPVDMATPSPSSETT